MAPAKRGAKKGTTKRLAESPSRKRKSAKGPLSPSRRRRAVLSAESKARKKPEVADEDEDDSASQEASVHSQPLCLFYICCRAPSICQRSGQPEDHPEFSENDFGSGAEHILILRTCE